MIYDTFGFGLVLGLLIGSLSYLILSKLISNEYDRHIFEIVNNFKKYLDEKADKGEEVFEE